MSPAKNQNPAEKSNTSLDTHVSCFIKVTNTVRYDKQYILPPRDALKP